MIAKKVMARPRKPEVSLPCRHCGEPFVRKHRGQKFCSRRCAAIVTNHQHSMESRANQRRSITQTMQKVCSIGFCETCGNCFRRDYPKDRQRFCSPRCGRQSGESGHPTELWQPPLPHAIRAAAIAGKRRRSQMAKRFRRRGLPPPPELWLCHRCDEPRTSPGARYCSGCFSGLAHYRSRCAFRFDPTVYPDVFDLTLAVTHGWYSPGGKWGRNTAVNLGGVSWDHLLSIKDGYTRAVPPQIMRHPANARLLLHSDNSRKNSRSAISLTQLKLNIAAWDQKWGFRGRRKIMVDAAGIEPA